jgi:HEAT repeat protein
MSGPEQEIDWDWIGPATTEALVGYLRRSAPDDYRLRREAIRVLGNRRSPDAFAVLIELLGSDDWSESDSAAEALAHLGDTAAIPHLERMYAEACEYLARPNRLHFGEMRPTVMLTALMWLRSSSEVVRLLLAGGHSHERVLAAMELGRRGDQSATEALQQARSDPDEYVREAASEALARLGDFEAERCHRERE